MEMELNDEQRTALESIIVNLSDSDSDTRRWAVYDLEQFPPQFIVDPLLTGITDEHRAVREAAAEVIESIPAEQCLRRLTPLLGSPKIEVRNLVATVIAKFGDEAVDYLIEALVEGNEDVRKFSADILGLARSEKAIEELAKAMYDPVENVGISAAEAFGKIQSPKGLEYLMKAFNDRAYLKRECAEAMGLLGVPEAAHFLESHFLDNSDLLIRYAMVDAMGNSGDLSTLTFLETALPDLESALDMGALSAMMKIAMRNGVNLFDRNSLSVDRLISAVKEGDEDFLQQLTDHLDPQIGLEYLQALAEISSSLNTKTLVALIRAIAPHSELHGFVHKMADHEDDWVAYTAVEHLDPKKDDLSAEVVKSILVGNRQLPQLAAMKIIPKLDHPAKLEWVKPFQKSTDFDLRSAAEELLK